MIANAHYLSIVFQETQLFAKMATFFYHKIEICRKIMAIMDKFWNDLPDVIYSFKNHTYVFSSLRINSRQEKVTIVLFFDRVRDSVSNQMT